MPDYGTRILLTFDRDQSRLNSTPSCLMRLCMMLTCLLTQEHTCPLELRC